jgi:acetyltransferase-like isoleucine patch superfamily enzyme
MSISGVSAPGRLATRLASLFAPPYMARFYLARLSRKPYVDPSAVIHHEALKIDANAFIADRVILYQASGGGDIELGAGAHVLRDSVLETGQGGRIQIGINTFLHPRCQVMAYKGNVTIGNHVAVAPGCAFYAYNHGIRANEVIKQQPLESRGGISVGDGAWLGFGVIVLDGVSIGRGAVIGAGSVVTSDVPDNGIAVGNPARVVSERATSSQER